MQIATPTTRQELDALFGSTADIEEEVTPLGDVDPRFWRTVNALRNVIDDQHTLTLARDWEGCIFGLLDPASNYGDVFAFTEDGRVGLGGVNQPVYMDRDDFVDGLLG